MSIGTNDCIQGQYLTVSIASIASIDTGTKISLNPISITLFCIAVRVSGSRDAKHASETQLNDSSERRHYTCGYSRQEAITARPR